MMMLSDIGRPSCDRSCEGKRDGVSDELEEGRAATAGAEAGAHLDVVALIVVAALAEQAVLDDAVHVELVEDRVGVLGERRREDDDLVDLAHRLEEGCSEDKRQDGLYHHNSTHYLETRSARERGRGRRRTVDTWPLDDVDVVELVLDLDGHDVVGLVDHLHEEKPESERLAEEEDEEGESADAP